MVKDEHIAVDVVETVSAITCSAHLAVSSPLFITYNLGEVHLTNASGGCHRDRGTFITGPHDQT